MKIKLKDVAQAAGVSVSTVSRVINGDRERPASKETADKIWGIVEKLGYVPNQSAKNLVKGDGEDTNPLGKIGCIYTSSFDLNNDPFFSCIGLGIQKELNRQNYNLAYAVSAAAMDYKELYSYLVNHPTDGIIVLGRFEKSILDMLKKHFEHLIYAGVNAVDAGFDEVICDGYQGAKQALSHLMDMGHGKIGYIGYIPEKVEGEAVINEHRYNAYCDLMEERGIPVNPNYIIHTRLRTTESYTQTMDYLKGMTSEDMPTAFYCANDATAFGAMKALKENGYKIPEDVALVGLDNVEMTMFVSPTLSTISVPQRNLGIQAVRMLLEQIEKKRNYPLRVNLPFELIVRESSDFKRIQ